MKRIITLLLTLLLTFAAAGCQEEAATVVYEKPTFTPGTMESDLLQAEPGNYQRSNDTGDRKFVEIENGYYMVANGYIYYADKTNLEAWVLLCNDPNCSHHYCTAAEHMGQILYEKDRLWYCTTNGTDPTRDETSGHYLISVAKDGSDKRWEYNFQEELIGHGKGGAVFLELYSGGYMVACDVLQPDGSMRAAIWLVDMETGPRKVFERVYEYEGVSYGCMSYLSRNRYRYAISGDMAITSYAFTDDFKGDRSVLCWFKEGEPVFSDISQFSIKGGYLCDGILRCLQPGDGYYDIDLETGAKTRLADAQLEDSGAVILQPNCIIESTLLNPENTAQTQKMRFFDGDTWHDVALPEGLISTPEAPFDVVALTSDRVIFRVISTVKDPVRFTTVTTVTFYEMVLGKDGYTVEYMCAMDDSQPNVKVW